jgi:hypothetical protein
MWHILGMVLALLLGIYIGLGFPGLPGREDRVVSRRGRRVHHFTPLDLLRRKERQR